MEKIFNMLFSNNSSDERIKRIEMKIWSEFGMVILLLSIIDVIVRDFILKRPFEEYATSLVAIGLFMIFFLFRAVITGILHSEVDTLEKFRKKIKTIIIFDCFLSLVILIFLLYQKGFPKDIYGCFLLFVKFAMFTLFVFTLQYLIAKISWNNSNKM
ncbi:DUF6773 family protein [Bacillus cereus]|uniref:DUF6773 family protein n=1 Tax=Bacillus cereus TaxID=1396 RepID=UPI00187936C4|nr:DUF6773 family protein [Bacillus cereus]MBE7099292.1 hypothetical protein [Bacillus cereus]